ncbi:von Willebrand factor A domain-containing protein 5A-like [Balamuthia mandrillaris]
MERGEYKASERVMAPESVLTTFSRKMARKILKQTKTNLFRKRIVAVVPTTFNDSQRSATKEALLTAGLDVARLINEGTAACLAYRLHTDSPLKEIKALVVNWGASSLAVDLLFIEEGICEVRQALRRNDIGGDEMTLRMVASLIQRFNKEHKAMGLDCSDDQLTRKLLWNACTLAKEQLSEDMEARIDIVDFYQGLPFSTSVSRTELEEWISDLLSELEKTITEVCARENIPITSADKLVLAGGTCNIPSVVSKLTNLTGLQPLNSIDPTKVCAIGGAIQASLISSIALHSSCMSYSIQGAGLYQRGERLHLTESKVEATVVHSTSKISAAQSFENGDEYVEAVYVYPLESGSVVCAFTVEVDGKLINGVIQEKEAAAEAYDDAISEGHGAYLLEEVSTELFKINVGNLKPHSKVKIVITYLQNMTLQGNEYRFCLPTLCASASYAAGCGTTITATTSVNLQCQFASAISSITSPTHILSTCDINGGHAVVTLTDSIVQDMVLKIRLKEPSQPSIILERASINSNNIEKLKEPTESTAVMVTFCPSFELLTEDIPPTEVLFLADRSGSMSEGNRMNHVKSALILFLKSLPLSTNITFNITGFGSQFRSLFASPRMYNDDSVMLALQYVSQMKADMGGTELLCPLQALLQEGLEERKSRQIILLTDGEVTNTEEVINYVASHRGTTRVFTLGIGNTTSHRLITGLADVSAGRFEFVTDHERLEGKVMRHLKRALQPRLQDPQLDWGELPVREVCPDVMPSIYANNPVSFFALLDNNYPNDHFDGEITLRAKKPDGSSMSFKASGKEHSLLWEGTSQIHALMAKQMISDREQRLSQTGHDSEKLQKELLQLSLRYNLASSVASFVAVEEREEATKGSMLPAIPSISCGIGAAKGASQGGYPGDLLLIDVIPLGIGFDVNNDGVMHTMLQRNTTIPVVRTERMEFEWKPGQELLIFSIYEGERPSTQHNNYLGNCVLRPRPPQPRAGRVIVDVRFDIDANGVLFVAFTDVCGHASECLTVSNESGRLSQERLEELIKAGQEHQREDLQMAHKQRQLMAQRAAITQLQVSTSVMEGDILSGTYDEMGRRYLRLVFKQAVDGGWHSLEEIEKVLYKEHGSLASNEHYLALLLHTSDIQATKMESLWASLLGLAALELLFNDKEEEWELLAEKTRSFIAKTLNELNEQDDLPCWLERAKQALHQAPSTYSPSPMPPSSTSTSPSSFSSSSSPSSASSAFVSLEMVD